MIKSKRIAGSRVLAIIRRHIVTEEHEEVITDCFRMTLPALLGRYLPIESYIAQNESIFEVTLKILASGKFISSISTQEVLLSSALDFAQGPKAQILVLSWFNSDKVFGFDGTEI